MMNILLNINMMNTNNNNDSDADSDTSSTGQSLFNLMGKIDILTKGQKYKKVIKLIESKEENLTPSNKYFFILFDFKMKCYFKLIKHKIKKLLEGGWIVGKRLRVEIEMYLDKTHHLLQTILTQVKEAELTKQFQELLLQDYTEALYLQAKYCLLMNQIPDCTAYLCIAHQMFKTYIDYCKEPKTLSIYQNTLLLLSTILIKDKNYQTALEHLKICLKFCFQEIFIRIDIEKGVAIDDLPWKKRSPFNKIISNIITCLFHLGVCYENIDNLIKAIEAYKQTRFFSDKFILMFNPIFADIIRQTEKRAFKYYDLYLVFLEEKEEKKKKEEERIRLKQLNSKKNRELNLISTGMNNNIDKNQDLAKQIMAYQFPEIKTISVSGGNNDNVLNPFDAPEKKSVFMLTSLNMYHDLQSKDYRDFVMNNNDMNFNKFTKKTKEKLNQYNTKLRVKKNHGYKHKDKEKPVALHTDSSHLKIKTKKYMTQAPKDKDKGKAMTDSFHSIKQTTIQTNNTSQRSLPKRINTAFSTRKNRLLTETTSTNPIHLNNTSSIVLTTNNNSNLNLPSTTRKSRRIYKDEVIKYDYPDGNLFSKTYQRKLGYFDEMSKKEMSFQKKLMQILQTDTNYVLNNNRSAGHDTVDHIKQKDDANQLYRRLKAKVKDQMVKKKNMFDTEAHKNRELANEAHKKIMYVFEEKAIAGLNSGVFDGMQKYLHTQQEKMKKAFELERINKDDQFRQTVKNIPKKNNEFIAMLTRDIDLYEKQATSILTKNKGKGKRKVYQHQH